MKKVKQATTIMIIVHILFTYVQGKINPYLWSQDARVLEIFFISITCIMYGFFKTLNRLYE